MQSGRRFKLVLFDMDDTLLRGRTIFAFADHFGFKEELFGIINRSIEPYLKTIKIALLLKDLRIDELIEVFVTIPLQDQGDQVVHGVKKNGLTTAIVTNSYFFVAENLRERLGIDYVFANNLITNNGIVTGDITLHNTALERCDDGRIYSICKGRVLLDLCRRLRIYPEQVIAIGDSWVDTGMIKKAGLGIAFNAAPEVQRHADISTNDMSILLKYL